MHDFRMSKLTRRFVCHQCGYVMNDKPAPPVCVKVHATEEITLVASDLKFQ